MQNRYREFHVALIVPCYNEENTIAKVITDFRESMPELDIYVFDNNSKDRTAEVARNNGAEVIKVKLQGKGNVVRRLFADVEADIYVMVDGDSTYDAKSVKAMIDKLIDQNLDMVVGCRIVDPKIASEAYRSGHQFGNMLLTNSVKNIFGGSFTDMLSGYRAFSRRYVKSFPALSKGFEIETELTVHALELRMPYGELPTPYGARPEGSESKLSTYKDGLRILKNIFTLYISERPLAFFSICASFLALISIILFVPIFDQYLKEGIVPRFPTAILSASLMISALLSLCCGLILDNVSRARREIKRLSYLSIPSVSSKKMKNMPQFIENRKIV